MKPLIREKRSATQCNRSTSYQDVSHARTIFSGTVGFFLLCLRAGVSLAERHVPWLTPSRHPASAVVVAGTVRSDPRRQRKAGPAPRERGRQAGAPGRLAGGAGGGRAW